MLGGLQSSRTLSVTEQNALSSVTKYDPNSYIENGVDNMSDIRSQLDELSG